jgi:hypothetical protein
MSIWNVYDTSIVQKIVGADSPNKTTKQLSRERGTTVEAFVRKKASQAHIKERKAQSKAGSPASHE